MGQMQVVWERLMDIQDGLTQIPEYAVAADRERAVEFFQPE
jgi:hypothetical protein